MHDIFAHEPDPLDGLLAAPPPPDTAALRGALLERTTRLVRRRRRLRRLALGAALATAACALAGVVVVRLAVRPAQSPQEVERHPHPPRAPVTPPDGSALALEYDAFDSTDGRSELYRRAGDRYLTEEADPQSALRCYGNALETGTEKDLTISPDDNWLLMAIKGARQKERSHAKNGG
jgi:hypothetical protein